MRSSVIKFSSNHRQSTCSKRLEISKENLCAPISEDKGFWRN